MILSFALCLCLAAKVLAGQPLPKHKFSDEELQRYFGVDSHEKAPEYEIVYPEYAIADSKRRVARSAISTSHLDVYVTAFGENLHMALEHDDSNIRPGLEAEYVTDRGIIKVPVRTDCIYTGRVVGEADSLVSVTTCTGLMAVINHATGPTYIEPLDDEHAFKRDTGRGLPHVAYKDRPERGASCSVRVKEYRCTERDTRPEGTKYLELAVIGDAKLYSQRGSNTQTALTTLFNAVKNVLQLDSLAGTNLVPILVHMVIMTPSQPGFTTSSDPEESLENAEGWLQNNRYPSSDKRHWDNAAVMSGWSFTEDTLGLANLGECDNEKAVSISSFLGFDVATDTAAHEIGHNLGMCHDSFQNNCPPSGYIMAAETTDVRVKPKWSSCSKRYYNHFIASKDCYNDS